jgi:hypothetical protein
MWWLLVFLIVMAGGGAAIAETVNSSVSDFQPLPAPADTNSFDASIFSGGTASMITTDPSTWPYSDDDPIGKVCNAVARAEGYNVRGSNPFRLNNPGDLSDGASTFGSESHSGSNVTHFPDAETGWQWLYHKWANIVGGGSSVYSVEMSWDQLAQKWAGNWVSWSFNVTRYLGVNRTDRVGDFFNV